MSLPTLPLINLPFESTDIWPDMNKSLPTDLKATYAPTGAGPSGIIMPNLLIFFSIKLSFFQIN